MCGIGVIVDCHDASDANNNDKNTSPSSDFDSTTKWFLRRRGPDHVEVRKWPLKLNHHDNNNDCNDRTTTDMIITVISSVLHMRGKQMTYQPQQLTEDVWLCWNGEVYPSDYINQDEVRNDGVVNRLLSLADSFNTEESDTTMLLKHPLWQTIRDTERDDIDDEDQSTLFLKTMVSVLSDLSSTGFVEFSICLVNVKKGRVYYARDRFGTRSLLVSNSEKYSSVALPKTASADVSDTKQSILENQRCQTTVCDASTQTFKDKPWRLSSVAMTDDAVAEGDHATVWSEVVPGLVHEYNVRTGAYRSVPFQTSLSLSSQLNQMLTPSMPRPVPQCPSDVAPDCWEASLVLEELLRKAVRRRLVSAHDRPACSSSIAVLFSGGLDSAVLSAIAASILSVSASNNNHEETATMELWNVAFHQDSLKLGSLSQARSSRDALESPELHPSKDRQAALKSFDELKKQYPRVNIQLKCINPSWADIQRVESHVRRLIHPKPASVMDINIGVALWFAASGGRETGPLVHDQSSVKGPQQSTDIQLSFEESQQQQQQRQGNSNLMTSSSKGSNGPRIVLLGMGADEQMGGYGRHRKAAKSGQLVEELELDIGRLWERNLGRDDRLVSDWGREARFPFLDRGVVEYLESLRSDSKRIHTLCDFDLPPGVGDKRILRLVARRLGLHTASGLVKRAIQFGSRVSHVSDKMRFGSRRQTKGHLETHAMS